MADREGLSAIHRQNPQGMKFVLYPQGNKTLVTMGPKQIILDMQIDRVTMCWFNWQMKGQFIQTAFADLPAEQREFLLTGITPEEWRKLFGKEE